ncbi:MAG: hypothetical protein HUJ51_01460 [Eggerthellaceae bacterium]|nr:hypothetical protein [Eggerthellaceae bacterium]
MITAIAIAQRMINVSLSTSAMAMIVLEHPFNKPHRKIGTVAMPVRNYVTLVHDSIFSSDIKYWVNMPTKYTEITSTPSRGKQNF